MKSDLQSQSHVYDSFQNQVVNVYFRNVKKEARLVSLHSPVKPSDLLTIAAARFNIPEHRIVLFYNGFRIDNYEMPITLTDKSIIHIIDKRNLECQNISVTFKPLGWTASIYKATLDPLATIKQAIIKQLVSHYGLQENKFFVVYVGKSLNASNSLMEEFIEDGSEMTVVQHKPAKEAYQKEAFEFNSSYHIKQKEGVSAMQINCPVTYLTSVDALKKKNQQQMALQQMQQMSGIAPQAAPKPFVFPQVPVMLNELSQNNPFNFSTINPEPNENIAPEPVAPLDVNGKKQSSSQNERCAPFHKEESGEPKIKIHNSSEPIEEKHNMKQSKVLLQLQSNYHTIKGKQGNAPTPNAPSPIPVPSSKELSDINSEFDSFFDYNKTKPAPS